MPQPIDAGSFRNAALAVQEQGGALDVNKGGQLTIRGRGWKGRSVLWLKDHIIPGHKTARNKRVLDALERSVHQIKRGTEQFPSKFKQFSLNRRQVAQLSNRDINRLVIRNVDKTTNDYVKLPKLMDRANKYMEANLPAGKNSRMTTEGDAILMGTAYAKGAVAAHGKTIRNQFMDFIGNLGRGKALLSGHEGVMAQHRNSDGTFSETLMRGCMQTVIQNALEHEARPEYTPKPEYQPDSGTKRWLATQHLHYQMESA